MCERGKQLYVYLYQRILWHGLYRDGLTDRLTDGRWADLQPDGGSDHVLADGGSQQQQPDRQPDRGSQQQPNGGSDGGSDGLPDGQPDGQPNQVV